MNSSVSDSNQQSCISMEVIEDLRELVDEDTPNFLKELLDSFLADAEHHLANMGEALSQDDLDTVMKAAHTLKSSSANLGALNLSQFCEEIELKTRDSISNGVVELYNRAVEEFTRVQSEIRALPDFD